MENQIVSEKPKRKIVPGGPINSYAVVGTKFNGIEVVLQRFKVEDRPVAETFALSVDMSGYDDIEVRPSREKPPREIVEFRPPFQVVHRQSLSSIMDADGRCAAQLFGPRTIREQNGELFVGIIRSET